MVAIAMIAASCGGSTTNTVTASREHGRVDLTPSAGDEFTPPGTRLRMGQSAIVPYQIKQGFLGETPTYRLRVTVVSLTRAPAGSDPAAPRGAVPYYLRFTVTNLGSRELSGKDNQAVPVLQSLGTQGFFGSFFGGNAACQNPAPNELAPGKTWSGCDSQEATGTVTGAEYTGGVTSYTSSPVIWNP
jgi:hypothetical protein